MRGYIYICRGNIPLIACTIVFLALLLSSAAFADDELPESMALFLLNHAMTEISSIDNIFHKSEMLMLMSDVHYDAGRHSDAEKLAREVFSALAEDRSASNWDKQGIIASSLARIAIYGSLEEALDLAAHIDDPNAYDSALLEIGTSILKSDNPRLAYSILDNTENESTRNSLLSGIAVAMSASRMYEHAIFAAEKIRDQEEKDSLGVQIAMESIRNNDIENAICLTRKINNPALKSRALCEIAKHYIISKNIRNANKSYHKAESLLDEEAARSEHLIAVCAILSGEQHAIINIRQIADANTRDQSFYVYSAILARTNKIPMALEAARMIQDAWVRDRAYAEIALQTTTCKNNADVHGITREIQSSIIRARTKLTLARIHFDKDHSEVAKEFVISAYEEVIAVEVGGGTDVILLSDVSHLLDCSNLGDMSILAFDKAFSAAMEYEESTAASLLHDLFEQNSNIAFPVYDTYINHPATISSYLKTAMYIGLSKGLSRDTTMHRAAMTCNNECKQLHTGQRSVRKCHDTTIRYRAMRSGQNKRNSHSRRSR